MTSISKSFAHDWKAKPINFCDGEILDMLERLTEHDATASDSALVT